MSRTVLVVGAGFSGAVYARTPTERGWHVEAIRDHPMIRVTPGMAFDLSMLRGHAYCFDSVAIDEYFDDSLGSLPYQGQLHRVLRDAPVSGHARGDQSVAGWC
jgi:UDP-galactopyranose mutase